MIRIGKNKEGEKFHDNNDDDDHEPVNSRFLKCETMAFTVGWSSGTEMTPFSTGD